MEQRPQQPPEGKLIADAASRLDLSIREAARRAGISYGRWRQIVMGYQNVSPGVYAPVHAPARTVAKMAQVVGVTADEMEYAGQRPDVAEILRSTIPAPEQQFNDEDYDLPATPAQEKAIADQMEEIRFRVEIAHRRNPGKPLTGKDVFPTSPLDEDSWNNMRARHIPEHKIPRLIAGLRAWEAEEAERHATEASHN